MNRGREVLVGAVILVGIVVVVVGTLWLQGVNFGRPAIPVDLLVQDVGQLREGNTVKFRGVQIGRVSSFDVEPGGGAVRVRLLLDREVDIPDDVVGIIAPESLFGSWQTELVSRAVYPTFDYYDGPVERTSDDAVAIAGYAIPDISRLTATANEISENLAILSDRVERAFTDSTAADLQRFINNIEEVSEGLRDLVGQQASTFANVSAQVERAATEIGSAAEVGRSVLEDVDRLMDSGQVDSILGNVESASRSLDDLAGNMARSTENLDETLVRADSAFARIDLLTGRVARGEGALGMLFTDTTLVVRANEVLRELDLLLADFRENPKRYVRLSIF